MRLTLSIKDFSLGQILSFPSTCPLNFFRMSIRIPFLLPVTSTVSAQIYDLPAVLWLRCHPCLSITPILIDKILWWCIACPFKGHCQQMWGINTVLICHKPQEKQGEQGSTKGPWAGQRVSAGRPCPRPLSPCPWQSCLWTSALLRSWDTHTGAQNVA